MDNTENTESNLVRHARIELQRINEEPETIEQYVRIIQAFSDMGHSGGSAPIAIATIYRLLMFLPLSPLTNDPDEWKFLSEDIWGVSGGIWQNKRNSKAFSNDGGKTYYLLSEGGNDKNRTPLHTAKEY
jgi:hypothetical protein